jgi:hypothetical protein
MDGLYDKAFDGMDEAEFSTESASSLRNKIHTISELLERSMPF